MSDTLSLTPRHSRTTTTEYVLPTHANALGTVFGGQILAWMDLAGAICAQRHCGSICVTAGIDELQFERPIGVGQVARVEATITASFQRSVELEVTVQGENPSTGETWRCVRAFLTFVPLDGQRKPQAVPALVLESAADRQRAAAAAERRKWRLERRAQPLAVVATSEVLEGKEGVVKASR